MGWIESPKSIDNQGSEAWVFGGNAYLYLGDKAKSVGVGVISSSKLVGIGNPMGRGNVEGHDLRDVGMPHPRY